MHKITINSILLHCYFKAAHCVLKLCSTHQLLLLWARAVPARRNGSTDRHKVTCVKIIYLLNVVVKQEILFKTQKTKQATYCPVTCNRAPFITCYCV